MNGDLTEAAATSTQVQAPWLQHTYGLVYTDIDGLVEHHAFKIRHIPVTEARQRFLFLLDRLDERWYVLRTVGMRNG